MIERRDFVVGSGATLATLLLGNTPLPPIIIEAGGQLTQGGWLRGRVQPDTRALTLDGKTIPFANDGKFLVAFDRDAGPTAQLLATRANGTSFAMPLSISPRAWQIEHINAARRPGGITDENYARLRRAELARISAARRITTSAQGWRQDFIRPAPGRFSGRFGSQRVYRGVPGAYHSGLDIAGGANTSYVAPADGVVILAASAPFSLEGNLLMIDHGMGLNSAFLHSSKLLVAEGDSVTRGQVIGRIGQTGRATGPHLHWSMKWHESRIDPILMLRNLVSTETR
jgi:murein DD-endopeptidase MepM/ murein hydrolase activator NlpD